MWRLLLRLIARPTSLLGKLLRRRQLLVADKRKGRLPLGLARETYRDEPRTSEVRLDHDGRQPRFVAALDSLYTNPMSHELGINS
jgi:hypothetical protein